ncbi:MAG TPA: TIGR03435 family protein [Terriglobus sp.]
MPANATPSFDVAVIKPSDTSASHGTGIRTSGRHINVFNFSVGELIAYSYGLHQKQIAAGTASLLDEHFDIDGVPDVLGRPSLAQSRMMFQRLLVSRFKLTFHYEQRELSSYAIQVAKGGSKLTRTTSIPGNRTGFTFNCQAILTVRNASIADVAKGMQEAFLDKPVVDETDLKDRYDFDLKWTPDESQSYCPVSSTKLQNDPNAPPGLYTAMQEQLGLKLVPTKASIQVMVIDHLEQPSEN